MILGYDYFAGLSATPAGHGMAHVRELCLQLAGCQLRLRGPRLPDTATLSQPPLAEKLCFMPLRRRSSQAIGFMYN